MTVDATKSTISAAQMRALEAEAIGSKRVSGVELMERAGAGVVAAITNSNLVSRQNSGHAVVLCGPGNNGGDGYVVARLLSDGGWHVDVFALGNPDRLPPDAERNYRKWLEIGPVRPFAEAPSAFPGTDLLIDGLFGIGLTRELDALVGDVLSAVPEGAHRVAIDVPSGWDADGNGVVGDHCFVADQVVTFHALKPAHSDLAKQGARVDVVDIGL